MKKRITLLLAALHLICSQAYSSDSSVSDSELEELSALIEQGSVPGAELSDAEQGQIKSLFSALLPDADSIGGDEVLLLNYYDLDGSGAGDYFQVDIKKVVAQDDDDDSLMWFHILYNPQEPEPNVEESEPYGSEDFGKYRGMGREDAHYFILVGNIEIRAVAVAEAYKSDIKIKNMLLEFKLEDIEKL